MFLAPPAVWGHGCPSFSFFWDEIVLALKDYRAAVVVGFAEDRMMDIITGRAPPPARAESYRSEGSRELARPGPSRLETLRLIKSSAARE